MKVADLFAATDPSAVINYLIYQMGHASGHLVGKLDLHSAWIDAVRLEPLAVDMEAEFSLVRPIPEEAGPDVTLAARPDFVPAAPTKKALEGRVYRLFGRKPYDPARYSLDRLDWRQWKALRVVTPEGLPRLNPTQVAAHALFEMTWHGFGPNERLVLPARKKADGGYAVELPGPSF